MGDSQERQRLFSNGTSEDVMGMSHRDLINNQYGRDLGAGFTGDLTTIDGLVDFLNIASEKIISSFSELNDAVPENERKSL